MLAIEAFARTIYRVMRVLDEFNKECGKVGKMYIPRSCGHCHMRARDVRRRMRFPLGC